MSESYIFTVKVTFLRAHVRVPLLIYRVTKPLKAEVFYEQAITMKKYLMKEMMSVLLNPSELQAISNKDSHSDMTTT